MKANNEDIWTWLEIPWAGDSTEKHKFIYSAEIWVNLRKWNSTGNGFFGSKDLTGHCRIAPLAAWEPNSRIYEVDRKRLEMKNQFIFAKLGPID